METERAAIEAALAAWHDAEQRLASAIDGEADALTREVERQRAKFQRLSAARILESIQRLKEAERRRATATPSTPSFYEAAREEQRLAAEVWESARQSDEDTPQTGIPISARDPQ